MPPPAASTQCFPTCLLKARPLCSLFPFYRKLQHTELSQQNITINVFPLEAEVYFLFEHDGKAEMFLLDPSSMRLKSSEKQAGEVKVPRHCFCSLNALCNFFLVETFWATAGAEHLDRPHLHWPLGMQTHLEHKGEPQAACAAHRTGDQPPGAVFWQLLLTGHSPHRHSETCDKEKMFDSGFRGTDGAVPGCIQW